MSVPFDPAVVEITPEVSVLPSVIVEAWPTAGASAAIKTMIAASRQHGVGPAHRIDHRGGRGRGQMGRG